MYVLLTGNIGVGKTTAVDAISHGCGLQAFHEPLADNLYFSAFLEDPKRWTFHAQVEFFYGALMHAMEIAAQRSEGAVQDRGPHEMLRVFAAHHLTHGTLSPKEHELLTRALARCETTLRIPNVLVHLVAPIDQLERRIHARARLQERTVSRKYLEELDAAYERFVAAWTRSPVEVVDTSRIDTRTVAGATALCDIVQRYAGERLR